MNLRSCVKIGLSAMWLSATLGLGCFSSNDGHRPDAGESFDSGASPDATLPDAAAPDAPAEAALEAAPDAAPEAAPEAAADAADAAQAEAATDAAGDAPADSPRDATVDAGPAPGVYVDPVSGLDTNPGTQAQPFKTIYHAAQVLNLPDAGAGQTVYLADGTYDSTTQPNLYSTFNSVTFVRGSAPGMATIAGQGTVSEGLLFNAGGGVANVSFKNTGYGVQAAHGAFTMSGVSFDGAGKLGFPISFINDTVATIDSTGTVPFLANIPSSSFAAGCMYLDNTANVTWTAVGTLTSSAYATNCVFMRGGAQLSVDGMNMQTFGGAAFVLYDQARLTLKNSVIDNAAQAPGVVTYQQRAAIWMGGSQTGTPNSSLTLDGTSITGGEGSAVAYSLAGTTLATITLTNSHLDGNAYSGIWVSGTPAASLVVDITSTGTTFDGNGVSGITSPRGTLSMSGGSLSTNGGGAAVAAFTLTPGGIVLSDATATSSLTMRNVTLGGNSGNAIAFAGASSSTLDLGTGASLGGNTFSAIPAGKSALSLTALVAASAIGNTWMPGVQGASASGAYTATTTLTGPASGQNVTEPSGASVVLAP